MENVPRVGVCVILKQNNKILLGKRKGSHGAGFWAFPGGHLEFNEDVLDCAIREVKEEVGIEMKNLKIETFTNDIFTKENKHYITLILSAEIESGDVTVMEPNKCEEWKWFSWDDLPQPLFPSIENLLKVNFNPFN